MGREPINSGADIGVPQLEASRSRQAAERLLEALRHRMTPPVRLGRVDACTPIGITAIDACLPDYGLVRGALHEVAAEDHRAMPAALGFLVALMMRLHEARGGFVLWPILRHMEREFGTLYAPGFRMMGVDPGTLLIVHCRSARELLWTMEEGARLGGLGAVVGVRPAKMTLTQSRRLQLAGMASGTPILLSRRHDDDSPSSAVTRWRIGAMPSIQDQFGFFAALRWKVTLEHVRGGRSGTWIVEWDHDAHRFHSSAVLADRTAAEHQAQKRRA